MTDMNLGTASGKVRITYESVGAQRATSDLKSWQENQLSAGNSMATWAKSAKIHSAELDRYNNIVKEVNNSHKISLAFTDRLNKLQQSGTASRSQLTNASRQATVARQSFNALLQVQRISAIKQADDMAGYGSLMAQKLAGGLEKGSSGIGLRQGRLISREINTALAASGVPGGGRAGQIIGTAIGGGMLQGISGSTVAVVGAIVAAAAVAAGSIAALGATLKAGATELVGWQDSVATLKAIGTSGQDINRIYTNVKQVAAGTRFTISELGEAATNAFVQGIPAGQQMVLYLKAMADVAAASHKPLSTVDQLFRQINAEGKVSMRDVRQLANLNIDAYKLLAQYYGKTEQQVSKMKEVPLTDLLKAIEASPVGGAATGLTGITESTAKLKKSVTELGAALLQPFFPATDSADVFSRAIDNVRGKIEQFTAYVEQHRAGLIEVWTGLGKTVIIVAGIVGNSVLAIMGTLGILMKGIGAMVGSLSKGIGEFGRLTADILDVVGLHGQAKIMRAGADALSSFGNSAYEWGNALIGAAMKGGQFNQFLANSWEAIDKWKRGALAAKKQTDDTSDSVVDGAKKFITIDDALEKLGVTSEQATKGISGTDKEFRAFLKQLQDAPGITQEVIDTVKRLRENWVSSGRTAKELADAIDAVGDSQKDAASSSKQLITALQDLGLLESRAADEADKFNETLADQTDIMNANVDPLYKMGTALITASGHIDTFDKNGRNLVKSLKAIRDAGYEEATALAQEGQDPMQAYQRAHDAMMLRAADFGLVGDVAEKFVRDYLGDPHEFQILFTVRGDKEAQDIIKQTELGLAAAKKKGLNTFQINIQPGFDQKKLDDILKGTGLEIAEYDPQTGSLTLRLPDGKSIEDAKKTLDKKLAELPPGQIPGQITIERLDPQKAVDQATGGNPLKIPAVLDFSTPQPFAPGPGRPGPGGGTPGFPGPVPVPVPPSPNIGGGPGGFDWGPSGAGPSPNPPGQGTPPPPGTHWVQLPDGTWIAAPDNPVPLPPSNPLAPPGGTPAGPPVSLVSAVTTIQDTTDNAMQMAVGTGNQRGEDLGNAFAQGILASLGAVKSAAEQMAGAATDYLGASPAKYGPLSGSGWTYYRGRAFSLAYAGGIGSGTSVVQSETQGMAEKSVDILTGRFKAFMNDMQEFSALGQHVLSFVNSLSSMAFNFANVVGLIGKATGLMPHFYIPAKPGAQQPYTAYPGGPGARGQAQQGLGPAAGPQVRSGNLTAQSSMTDKQLAIVARAQQLGLSPTEIIAALAVGQHESQWQNVGFMGFGPEAKAAGFNFDNDPQGAIDKFFSQYTSRKPQGLDVNDPNAVANYIWHTVHGAADPNYGSKLLRAMGDQRQSYDQLLQQAGNVALQPGGLARPSILRDTGGAGSGPQAITAAALVSRFFPQITEIGGSRPAGTAVAGTHEVGKAIDISIPNYNTPEGIALGNQIRDFLQQNAKELGVVYTIWQDQWRPASANFQVQGPPVGGHMNHIDVQFSGNPSVSLQGLNLPLGQPGQPMPVVMTNDTTPGLPPLVEEMARNDDLLNQALGAFRGGNQLTQQQTIPLLQHMDLLINQQNKLNTPESRATAQYLDTIRTGLMGKQGLQQVSFEDVVSQVQGFVQSAAGLVQDVFEVLDASLKAVAGTKELTGTLARGAANTQDVMNMIDAFQTYIELGAKIASTVGDVLGFASQIAGIGSAGGPFGGEAQAALAAAAGIAQLISAGLSMINAGIDIAQEMYTIGTKYLGRMITSLLGFGGYQGQVNFLLDTLTGQVKAYTESNPEMKTTLGVPGIFPGKYPGRNQAINTFYIYQGPGQDPRDTMNDAMFAVKSAGVGVFGYGE